MEEYKVKWETVDGGYHVSEWMTKQSARKMFDNKKKDLNNKIVWCELIFSSLDDDTVDEEQVIDSFDRKKVDIMGATMLFPL